MIKKLDWQLSRFTRKDSHHHQKWAKINTVSFLINVSWRLLMTTPLSKALASNLFSVASPQLYTREDGCPLEILIAPRPINYERSLIEKHLMSLSVYKEDTCLKEFVYFLKFKIKYVQYCKELKHNAEFWLKFGRIFPSLKKRGFFLFLNNNNNNINLYCTCAETHHKY